MKAENTKLRILEINAGNGVFGGVSAFLLNLFRTLDHNDYQISFLSMGKSTFEDYREEIEGNGGKIHALNAQGGVGKWFSYLSGLKRHLQENTYDVIHINAGSPGFLALSLYQCRRYSAAKVITHVHSIYEGASSARKKMYAALRNYLVRKSALTLACSSAAGDFCFGEGNYEVLNNGIDLRDFHFDMEKRSSIRETYGVREDELLCGFIGRMEPVKNPRFALAVFEEILRLNPSAKMWMAGDGSLLEEMKREAEQKNMGERLRFFGTIRGTAELLQGIDVLLMPSLSEGFGLSAVEAQCMQCEVFASDDVPEETRINEHIHYCSLDLSAQAWAEMILNCTMSREEHSDQRELYDIRSTAKKLDDIYHRLGRQHA